MLRILSRARVSPVSLLAVVLTVLYGVSGLSWSHVARRVETVRGNAASKSILDEAGIAEAGHLLIAIPEGFEAGGIAEIAKKLNPAVKVIARAHSKEEVKHLLGHGADRVIEGEEEIARQLVLSVT